MQREITLLIPTYKRAELLDKCLKSVSEQTFDGKIHCVISNNNSFDNTVDVVKDWKKKNKNFTLTFINNNESLEPIDNWMKTLQYIDTDYSKWLQDDDWMEKDALETMFVDLQKYEPNTLIYNCNIFLRDNFDKPIRDYYKNETKKLTTEDVINHVLQLAPVFPVSPTASIMKSKYIEEAIIFGQSNNICTKKLMGNDLVMNFFGVFNDLDTYYINKTLFNFYGGDDSISLVNNPKILSHCYLRSLALMIEYNSTKLTKNQNEIISHRVFATKFRGRLNKDFKSIEDVKGFDSKISLSESYKYLKKYLNL